MNLNKISKQCQLAGFTPETQEDIEFHYDHCKVCQEINEYNEKLEKRFQEENV